MRTLAIAICLLSTSAFAQTTRVELRALHREGRDRPAMGMNAYIDRPLENGFGVSAWLQIEEKWAEAYVGLTYSPRSWVQISISAGMEQAENPWRVAGSLWFGAWRFTSLTIVENGGSSWWYQSSNQIKVANWLKVGVIIRRFDGLGPRIDIALSQSVNIWAAYLPYDPEKNSVDYERILVAINRSF